MIVLRGLVGCNSLCWPLSHAFISGLVPISFSYLLVFTLSRWHLATMSVTKPAARRVTARNTATIPGNSGDRL